MGDSLSAEDEIINCRLRVAGMSGPNCVGRVERALMTVPGIQNAVADVTRGEAVVRAEGNASVEAITQALDQAGYRLDAVDGDLDPQPEPQPVPEPAPLPPAREVIYSSALRPSR